MGNGNSILDEKNFAPIISRLLRLGLTDHHELFSRQTHDQLVQLAPQACRQWIVLSLIFNIYLNKLFHLQITGKHVILLPN